MTVLLTIVLGSLAVMLIVTVVNVACFRPLRVRAGADSAPRVSVLLPARNEENNIGVVLSTLAVQEYDDYEVLVLDDNSDDATGARARMWARPGGRIRVIRGSPLPPGWGGKSFACHQLAAQASGDLLLFVDADTVHAPKCIAAAVSALQESGAGLLTLIPEQRMVGPWEKILLPLLHFSTFTFLPMPLVRLVRDPRLAMANGQCMLFRREVYERIGGHAAVRTALVEDVWLSRLVKQHGFTLDVRDGRGLVSCRMYSSLREIWDGFSKNLFAGFRYSVPSIGAVIVFNLLTSVLPPVLVLGTLLSGGNLPPWFSAAVAATGVAIAIRLLLAARFRLTLWSCLVHPVAMVIFAGIAMNSAFWVLHRGGARWKGRVYDFRSESIAH